MAPCAGKSGLPKVCARASVAVIVAPIADAASNRRLESMIVAPDAVK
jgi:hypothetical protein